MSAARLPLVQWFTLLLAVVVLGVALALPHVAGAEPDAYAQWVAEASAAGHETTDIAYATHVEALGDPIAAVRIVWESAGAPWGQALQVAQCESTFVLTARNGQYRGLFQLGDFHRWRATALGYTWDDMWRAVPNARVALHLWSETRSWAHWECKPRNGAPGGW